MPTALLDAVKALYGDVPMCVRTQEGLTPLFQSSIGVKQGCPLSPTLFGLFLDDLEQWVMGADGVKLPTLRGQRVPPLSYADDLLLVSVTAVGLQAQLGVMLCYTCFNVCLRDNHCPSQTGHRAHATQTQMGPSLLQPEAADRNGLALETGNSSGQQRAGVKARARAPPSRRGEDARCNKHMGWQATMHASRMTRMQHKAKYERVRKGKEESNASRAMRLG
jgi:hypothetical protein